VDGLIRDLGMTASRADGLQAQCASVIGAGHRQRSWCAVSTAPRSLSR